MNELDKETLHVANHLLKHSLSSDKDIKAGNNKAALMFIALIGFSGEEAVKILFRKNIGLKGIGYFRLAICILAFLALGAYQLSLFYNTELSSTSQPSKPLLGGIISIAFGLLLFLRALITHSSATRAKRDTDFTGSAYLFAFLLKENWSPSAVQYAAEPLFLLSTGIGFYFIDWLTGLAFIGCSVSVWLSFVSRHFIFGDTIYQSINKMKETQKKPSNKVT